MHPAARQIDNPRISLRATGATADPQAVPRAVTGVRIYYLHPLLAGKVEDWERWFAHCARLGFSHVLLAPPFQPGPLANIFLTADHNRLHPALGGGDATAALARAGELAGRQGLRLLLDLVVDRVARESPLAAQCVDGLPDPRRPTGLRGAAWTKLESGNLDPWLDLIGTWTEAGIAGFRCDTTDTVPAGIWSRIIGAARARRADTAFIAWRPMAALARRGFDLAACSSWAWDFRADWLGEDLRRAANVAGVLAMPEAPFERRVGDCGTARRQLALAATLGSAWLMPMGFEHGATEPLDPAHPEPIPETNVLSEAVADSNRRHVEVAANPPPELCSAPDAPVAILHRGSPLVIAANATLRQPVQVPGRGERLAPGEVVVLLTRRPPPAVRMPAPAVAAAVKAPRIAVEAIAPAVDGGRFAVKRRVGDWVNVEVDLITDGHEVLAGEVLWRPDDEPEWRAEPLHLIANDRWTARFPLSRLGRHSFTVQAWRDEFATLQADLRKKQAAGVDVSQDVAEGTALVARLAPELADRLRDDPLSVLLADETSAAVAKARHRPFLVRHEAAIPVDAGRPAESFAAWYELFPRSQSGDVHRHGTFEDVIARLPAIREMGFDVLYMPPIHPIGRINRKGRNNALKAGPEDPGSPYAIGAEEGGHDAIHPDLGTFDDFRRLIDAAAAHGMEVALDFAIQCSPDHPWLKQHPDWFAWRSDGSIRYAENPPKKYEDIVNVDFHAKDALPSLWIALRDVVQFWIDRGVRIFRVDNPHTKPLSFWEWMIGDIRSRHPDTIFLAEAFTRPKMMYRLAKIGFQQSYTYFTWRNSAFEMREYLTELTTTGAREFFRPHFFVNTPDINPLFLQGAGRAGFLIRAALAATLSGLWGVYSGFELCEAAALPGREEYADSEKYEIRAWDWNRPGNIVAEITRLNAIRHANPALHSHLGLTFLPSTDPDVLVYAKSVPGNVVVVAVSFDPRTPREADIAVPSSLWERDDDFPLTGTDLMGGHDFPWRTGASHIGLDPGGLPFLIWRLRPDENA
jgi:starch synthase (maltosyl-transferring)